MIYNGETNNQDICSLADDMAKSNPTSFPIKIKTLYANMGVREIWSWIFESYGGWQYDDSNYTDLPEATTELIANQKQYSLPIESAHLMGVAYKDESGTWHQLKPITLEKIQEYGAEDEFENTTGNPEWYRPLSNGFKVYPAANFSQDASIKVNVSRDISGFVVGDTTKTPGFVSTFHEAVPTFMAMKHCKINSKPQYPGLQRDWDGDEDRTGKEGGFKLRIKTFYGNQFRQMFPPTFNRPDIVQDYI